MASDNAPEDAPAQKYAPGGLVKGPADGSDSVPILIDLRCEAVFTAEQAWRFMAAKPGSREVLGGGSDSAG